MKHIHQRGAENTSAPHTHTHRQITVMMCVKIQYVVSGTQLSAQHKLLEHVQILVGCWNVERVFFHKILHRNEGIPTLVNQKGIYFLFLMKLFF